MIKTELQQVDAACIQPNVLTGCTAIACHTNVYLRVSAYHSHFYLHKEQVKSMHSCFFLNTPFFRQFWLYMGATESCPQGAQT